jgi:hypothetical protein
MGYKCGVIWNTLGHIFGTLMGTPYKHIGDNKKIPFPMSDGHLRFHIEPFNCLHENYIPKIVCQWCTNIYFTQMYSLGMDRMDYLPQCIFFKINI